MEVVEGKGSRLSHSDAEKDTVDARNAMAVHDACDRLQVDAARV